MTLNDLVMTYNDSKWLKTPEKQTRDQQTDRPTDRQTDRPTDRQ